MAEESESEAEVVVEKKGGKLTLILVAAVLVLGAAAAGVLLGPKLLSAPPPAEKAKEDPEKKQQPVFEVGEISTFAPIVIDSAGEDGTPHHVKVVLAVELADGIKDQDFKRYVPRGRQAAIVYLRAQRFEDLTDPKKFDKVQKELGEAIVNAVSKSRVSKVLVTDFVAQ